MSYVIRYLFNRFLDLDESWTTNLPGWSSILHSYLFFMVFRRVNKVYKSLLTYYGRGQKFGCFIS